MKALHTLVLALVMLGLVSTANAYTALQQSITGNGMYQRDLVLYLQNVRDAVNELVDDHATMKTTLDMLQFRSQNYVSSVSPVLAIDTNFDVKNTEVTIFVAGSVVYSLTDNTSCDTGTTKTLGASKWGAFVVEASAATTLTCTWAASDYASEALALAAAKALTPATGAVIGYVTVQAHASGFTAGTDALTTGTGGNVANATNYYSLATNIVPAGPATLTNSTALSLTP